MIHRPITIRLEPREDGGLRIWSDDIPGLILSHNDQEAVLMDIGPAIIGIMTRNPLYLLKAQKKKMLAEIKQRIAILEEEIAALNGEIER